MQFEDGTRSVIGRWAGFMTVVAMAAAGVWWATSTAPSALPPAAAASSGGQEVAVDDEPVATTTVVPTTPPAATTPDVDHADQVDDVRDDVEDVRVDDVDDDRGGRHPDPGSTADEPDADEPDADEPSIDELGGDVADASSNAVPQAAPTSDGPGYPAAPDGSPLPVRVVYDGDVVTLSGAVSSTEDRDRLALLAAANSTSSAPVVDNQLLVVASVPRNVGVRVTELQSERFPEGSAEIRAEHSMQFMRVVDVLKALPNTTVTVVGHADQRGDDDANMALSEQRAQAVVNYIVYLGVSPTRVAALAVGESDPLTLDDDEHALALNRRTEFVFYGVFAD